jgi:hypothetical protein
MTRKITVIMIILVFSVLSVWVSADMKDFKKESTVSKDKIKKIGLITPDGKNHEVKYLRSPLENVGVKASKNRREVMPANAKLFETESTIEGFEDIIRYSEPPYPSIFGFDGTDSIAMWFRPVTQCSLRSVIIRFYSDVVGRDFDIEVRKVNPAYDGVYMFDSGTELGADPNDFPQDWLGEIMGSYTYNVATSGVDVELPIVGFGISDEDLNLGLHDFAVAWRMPDDLGSPSVVYSNTPRGPNDHHGIKWYHLGQAQYGDGSTPAWVPRQNFSIAAKVLYYGDPPPSITNTNDIADQYNSVDPGPYTVNATVSDLGTDVFTGYLRRVALILDDDADAFNAANDTLWLYDQPTGTDTEVNLSYDIPNPGVGKSVYYWWHAEDNGLENTADPEAQTHITLSQTYHFTVREKNPDASILLVDDTGGQQLAADVFTRVNYSQALDAYGYVYDLWDMLDADTTSLEILNLYSSVIWINGAGQGGYAADLRNTQIAPYLDNGGNLFFSTSDFVGVVEEFEVWTEWTEPTDPFIVDYLKVAEILDDANIDETNLNRPEDSQDTLRTGVAGTYTEVLTDTFVADMYPIIGFDYSGEVIPSEGTTIFQVYNAELGLWDESSGYVYEGDYKLVFLPWCFEGIVNGAVRVKILSIILGDIFGENAAPLFSNLKGSRYGVVGNGPFPISVDVEDNDGSIASVELGYSIDGGEYTWVPMASRQATYTASIPELAAGQDTVAYSIRATDDLGKTRYHTQINEFHVVDFVVANTGLLYCGDDPYDWYYGSSVDSIVVNALDALIPGNYDYWDVDVNGTPDFATVLSNYDGVFWHGYADWVLNTFPEATADNPFADYVAGGGKLLFSSEEMIGQSHFDDGSYTFGPGDAAYDILNVEWIGYDWNYDTIRVVDEDLPITANMDSVMGLEELPFGYMTELIDAINLDAIYFLDAWLAPGGYNNWYSDFGVPGMAFAKGGVVVVPFPLAAMDSLNRAQFLQNVFGYFITDIDKDIVSDQLPEKFALKQNYPNPFNPTTNISFDLAKAGQVKLTVFNTLGQKIRTLVDKQMSAGRYEIQWDGTNNVGAKVASGIYLYRIEADNFVTTKKMMLMK